MTDSRMLDLLAISLSSLRILSFIIFSFSCCCLRSSILAYLAWKTLFLWGADLKLRKSLMSLFFSLKLKSRRFPVAPTVSFSSFSMQSITYFMSYPVEASFERLSCAKLSLVLALRYSSLSSDLIYSTPSSSALCLLISSFLLLFSASLIFYYC